MSLRQYREKIRDFVRGDSLLVQRTITRIPDGLTISKAYLTVKDDEDDLDAAAIFQLTITSTLSASGQITDTGADATGVVRFTLSHANTILLTAGQSYFFDIELIMSNDGVFTISKGTIKALEEVTIAST